MAEMYKRLILGLSSFIEKPFSSEEIISGRYKVMEHLGMGSYGHSYLVLDLSSQDYKVLKALRLHKRITKIGLRGFEFEKELLNSIHHPGFPHYFEGGTYKHIPYFTMEYLKGKNYEQLIFSEGWKLSEREAFSIAYELLEMIGYLHERNIVHRDIRIPNVIFDGAAIKLIDLGLARSLDEVGGKKSKESNPRKELNFQADFYGLGHFLLFLIYSNFSFPENGKEKSWEEELDITDNAKHILRKLLMLETPYDNCVQVKKDIQNLMTDLGGMNNVIL
ncbi:MULTISPECIES: serine/threonine protein kinase [Neobacillus]|nr:MULTISPECIES: protein kinase [Neobacillus]